MGSQAIVAAASDHDVDDSDATSWITQKELDRDTYTPTRPERLSDSVGESHRRFADEATGAR